MLDYFNDFYINQMYGYAFVVTEVLFVLSAVFLLTKFKWKLKDILFIFLKVACSWIAIVFLESLIYMWLHDYYNLIVYPIYLLVYSVFFCKYDWKVRISLAFSFYVLFLGSTGISEPVGAVIRNNTSSTADWTMVFQIFFVCCISVFLYFFGKMDKNSFLPFTYVILITAINLVYYVILLVIMFQYSGDDMAMMRLLFNCSFFVMETVAYLLFYYTSKEHEKRLEAEAIQLRYEQNQEMLEANKKSYEDLSILRHDIKNQYFLMGQLLKDKKYDELQEYFDNYTKTNLSTLESIPCPHSGLRSILMIERGKIADDSIKLNVRCAIPAELPFNDVDLCSLVTNILDNAIEGCKANKTFETQQIDVAISLRNNCLLFRVSNPIDADRKDKALSLNTIKKDKQYHGFGHKIIQMIVDKYNGAIHYQVDDGKFIVDVMLICPSSEDDNEKTIKEGA